MNVLTVRGYLVSGSLDVVIVWSVGRWAPVLRLSSTRGSHPRVVRPICLHSNDYFLDVFHQTKVWPTLQANSPLTPFKLETSCASQVAAILQDNRVMVSLSLKHSYRSLSSFSQCLTDVESCGELLSCCLFERK